MSKAFRSTLVIVAVLLCAFVALGSAASASPAGPGPGDKFSVRIKAFQYRPNRFEVTPGQRVVVRNMDGQKFGIPHSLTAKDGSFDTEPFVGGDPGFDAPLEPGRYPFFCEVHHFMRGVLIVTST
jgi:plastocyanin